MARSQSFDIDRPPTERERVAGVVLGALVAIVCLPLSVAMLMMPSGNNADRAAEIGTTALFAFLGIAGAFICVHAALTRPAAPTARAHRVCAWVVAATGAALVVASFVTPTGVRPRVGSIALFLIALGHLLAMRKPRHLRKKKGASERVHEAATPSNYRERP